VPRAGARYPPTPHKIERGEQMARIKIGPYVDEQVHAWLAEVWETSTGGASYVIESMYWLYRRALSRVRGQLSIDELVLMIETCETCVDSPGVLGEHLLYSTESAVRLSDAHGIDAEHLLGKLEKMQDVERWALELWCRRYWQSSGLEPQEYAAELAG